MRGLTVAGLGRLLRRLIRTSARRRVVAAVPVRPRAGGGVEFLLVRTSDGERWTFPKGGCERGETLAEAAGREAVEEAGAIGRVGDAAFAEYRYRDVVVAAFLLEVEETAAPEELARDPTWFGLETALGRLSEGRDGAVGAMMERVLLAAERAAVK